MKLIFATGNGGKIKEMIPVMADLDIGIISMAEAGITDDIVEDGETLQENSLIKARYVAERTGEWTFAEDAGIFIKGLDGEPGLHSARWGGRELDGMKKVAYTLDRMKDIPVGQRQATFKTSVALVAPDGRHWIFLGETMGKMATEPQGENEHIKLPYSRLFIPDGFDRTYSQMTKVEKGKISHRGKALNKLKTFLRQEIL